MGIGCVNLYPRTLHDPCVKPQLPLIILDTKFTNERKVAALMRLSSNKHLLNSKTKPKLDLTFRYKPCAWSISSLESVG